MIEVLLLPKFMLNTALNKLGGSMNLLAIEKLEGGNYNIDSILLLYMFF